MGSAGIRGAGVVLGLRPCEQREGVALLAVLILMAVTSVMGATVLTATSTEVAISGHYRRGIQAQYFAEAGIEESRARLREFPATRLTFIGDSTPGYDPNWSAYILTAGSWSLSEDPTFSGRLKNYIPVPGNPTNTAIIRNSLESKASYWVKIRHKTEYDAEQAGHRTGTPHYWDGDGSRRRHRRTNPGQVIFFGYPTPGSSLPRPFTTGGKANGFPIEVLTAHAPLDGSGATVEVEVAHHPGPRRLAAVYAREGVSWAGASSTVSGVDRCGEEPPRPPIYTTIPSTTLGRLRMKGNPPRPVQGMLALDLSSMVQGMKPGGRMIETEVLTGPVGSPADLQQVYAAPTAGTLTLRGATGYGIVLVHGDLRVEGPLQWHGLIVSSGTLSLDGSLGRVQIIGAVLANRIRQGGGEVTITYDSCLVQASLRQRPLTIFRWRQVF